MLYVFSGVVYNENGKIECIKISNYSACKKIPVSIIIKELKGGRGISGISLDKNENLIYTNGRVDRYPNVVGGELTNKAIVIIGRVSNGFRVMCHNGISYTLNERDTIKIAKENGIANGKVVNKSGSEYIAAINGEYEQIEFSSIADNMNRVIEKKGVDKRLDNEDENIQSVENEARYARSINIRYTKLNILNSIVEIDDDEIDDVLKTKDVITGLTAEQKLTRAFYVIKQYRPLYSSILLVMKMKWTYEIETMGVTAEALVINPVYILTSTIGDCVFGLLHESMHAIFGHSLRLREKDHMLWNIACDIYVNKYIVEDLKDIIPRIEYKNGISYRVNKESVSNYCGYENRMTDFVVTLKDLVYCKEIELGKDSALSIYKMLLENADVEKTENNSNDEESKSNGSSGGNEKNRSDGSGKGDSSGENNDKSGSNKRNEKREGNENKDSSSDSGKGEDDKINGEGNTGGKPEQDRCSTGGDKGNKGEEDGRGGSRRDDKGNETDDGQFDDRERSTSNGGTAYKVSFSIGESKYEYDVNEKELDILYTTEGESITEEQAKENIRGLITKAYEYGKQNNLIGTNLGASENRLFDIIKSKRIKYTSLLRDMLVDILRSYNTYQRPDRRFLSRNMILPGPKGTDGGMNACYIAVDTSGSIGTEELSLALSKISQLFTQYKTKANILWWDTKVREEKEFKNIRELMRAKPKGGGGTSPECVYDYIIKKDREYKTANVKIIIFITDGIFDASKIEKYNKLFRNRTAWLVFGELGYNNIKSKRKALID